MFVFLVRLPDCIKFSAANNKVFRGLLWHINAPQTDTWTQSRQSCLVRQHSRLLELCLQTLIHIWAWRARLRPPDNLPDTTSPNGSQTVLDPDLHPTLWWATVICQRESRCFGNWALHVWIPAGNLRVNQWLSPLPKQHHHLQMPLSKAQCVWNYPLPSELLL